MRDTETERECVCACVSLHVCVKEKGDQDDCGPATSILLH